MPRLRTEKVRTNVRAFCPTARRAEKARQSDIAYDGLKRMIMGGRLPAGSQILELEASEQFGVSRTPVREAMVRLQQEGLVELRSRHGMRVLPVSAEDMREIYEVLTALEGKAAELAAGMNLTAEQLTPLEQAVEAMDRALESDDLKGWAMADEKFHAGLISLARNDRLKSMVAQLWDQAHRARMATLKMRPTPKASNREHRAVVDAIRRGDADTARSTHENHRRNAGELLVSILKDLSAPNF